MPDLPVPDTMQAETIFTLFGQTIENVYHIVSPTGVDAAALLDCAEAVHDWVGASLMPKMPDQVTYVRTEVKNISIPAGGMVVRVPSGVVTGAIAGGAEPGGTTFSIALRTGNTGRSYRGRKFVPAVPVIHRVGNGVAAAWANDLVTVFNDLRTALAAFNQVLVIVSRIQDNLELLIPITTEVIAVNYTNLDIDSQRRRLTGRGT